MRLPAFAGWHEIYYSFGVDVEAFPHHVINMLYETDVWDLAWNGLELAILNPATGIGQVQTRIFVTPSLMLMDSPEAALAMKVHTTRVLTFHSI